MPYAIKKSGKGFKVANRLTGKTYSKKAQTRKTAVAQLRAIQLHTRGR